MNETAPPKEGGSSNLPVRTAILDPVAHYLARHQIRVPTRRDVEAAVALIPRRQPATLSRYGAQHTRQSVRAFDTPKWVLSVSPGVVSIGRKFTAPKEHFGHNDGVEEDADEGPKRGRVRGWSDKSRNRMAVTLESLDYEPMFQSGRNAAMVTLTLPGDGWEQLVPDIPTFKAMVASFRHAYRYAWGDQLRGAWKMEFQHRGAPHLHILMVPPAGLSRGRGSLKGRRFEVWLRLRWAQIVGAAEGSPARRDHELAGTHVSEAEVARYSDPRRIGSYFAKHGTFSAKDYQNEMPEHWRQAIEAGETGGGNFWGYWGLDKAIVTVELQGRPMMRRASIIDGEPVMRRQTQPPESQTTSEYPTLCQTTRILADAPPRDAVLAMRHLRKLARSRAFVRQVEVERWSVDERTGEVRMRRRKVRRKVAYLAGRSRGFLSVNDGPSTAIDIARILLDVEGPGADPRRRAYELVA